MGDEALLCFAVTAAMTKLLVTMCSAPWKGCVWEDKGFELRASHLLGLLFTTWATPPAWCWAFHTHCVFQNKQPSDSRRCRIHCPHITHQVRKDLGA
jgi:hypothetical protein